MQTNMVIAVVDDCEGVPVVWWVNLGRGSGIARLCGAWVLDSEELRGKLAVLIAERMVLTTAAGHALLKEESLAADRLVDPAGTLAAVRAARDELQSAYERRSAAGGSGRTVSPPVWPELPEPLDVDQVKMPSGNPRAARALGIGRWLVGLCDAWDELEGMRLARSYLRGLGGETARLLPVAFAPVVPVAVPA